MAPKPKPGRVTLDMIMKELMKDPDLSPETKEDLRQWLRKAKAENKKGNRGNDSKV